MKRVEASCGIAYVLEQHHPSHEPIELFANVNLLRSDDDLPSLGLEGPATLLGGIAQLFCKVYLTGGSRGLLQCRDLLDCGRILLV